MAYTDDAVKAKLSALNETQESIVTVAQWIMFHRYNSSWMMRKYSGADSYFRRHADRTGQLWLQRLKDSGAGKRLNLIYLANGMEDANITQSLYHKLIGTCRSGPTIESEEEG